MFKRIPFLAFLAISCGQSTGAHAPQPQNSTHEIAAGVPYQASASEPRLANLRMLTNGGENAEAYFSGDDQKLIFQAHRPGGTP